MKIINIIENLDKGAVENWLVSVFIESKKYAPEMEWTFFCILGKKGRLDELVLQNGGKIVYSPYTVKEKYKFLSFLRKELIKGDFDILHSHHDYLSGFYLLASIGIKFKYRILQIHNNVVGLPTGRKSLNTFLIKLFWYVDLLLNDKIIGIAEDTVNFFLKNKYPHKKGVLYYGFEFDKFYTNDALPEIRHELKISNDAITLLYVGKLDLLKNPIFIVDILNQMLSLNKNIHAIFIGEGDTKESIISKAKFFGIEDKIHLLGWRNDVATIMKASDIFIFPRVEYEKEGLGKVVVEAQAAGMCTLITTGVPADAIVIDELVKVIKLNNNPEEWCEVAIELLSKKKISRDEALAKLESSQFSLKNGTLNLLKLYA